MSQNGMKTDAKVSRKLTGGYYWHERLDDADQAQRDALAHVNELRHMTRSLAVTEHLLGMALALATIQAALHDLREVDGGR